MDDNQILVNSKLFTLTYKPLLLTLIEPTLIPKPELRNQGIGAGSK